MPFIPVNHSLGTPFIELPSIGSTNNYALNQIHANLAQPGTCYFAHEQTAGKGQRGKTWSSEKDANITLSLVLKPSFLQAFQQFELSACVSVATHQFLNHYIPDDLKIKWPNDLYWKDRKLGGILIENVIRMGEQDGRNGDLKIKNRGQTANWDWAVVGIGLNINQTSFPAGVRNPVSLKQITSQHYDVTLLARELCERIDQHYKQLQEAGIDSILELYNRVLYKKDQTVKFKKDSRNFQASVESVNKAGQLIIHHSIEEKIDFGQIEWIS